MKSAFLTADWQFHRPTEKEVTVDEVCWSERRLPRLRCRLLRCDLFWQPVTTEMLLWHMAMAESKWKKVYLVCEPCFGGLVQVDLHVFTQKGLHTKRAEHEGWHFRRLQTGHCFSKDRIYNLSIWPPQSGFTVILLHNKDNMSVLFSKLTHSLPCLYNHLFIRFILSFYFGLCSYSDGYPFCNIIGGHVKATYCSIKKDE